MELLALPVDRGKSITRQLEPAIVHSVKFGLDFHVDSATQDKTVVAYLVKFGMVLLVFHVLKVNFGILRDKHVLAQARQFGMEFPAFLSPVNVPEGSSLIKL